MDRSYLTHPKIVGARWEGVVLYPVLLALSEDMRLDGDTLDPVYLSAVTRIPVSVVSDGLTSLGESGVLTECSGSFLLTECSSLTHAPVRASRTQALPPVGGGRAEAGVRGRSRSREGFESYLMETWGDLIIRGKSLPDWIKAQEDAHPGLDLLAESRKARAWEKSQRKSKAAIRRFLSNWFNRAEGFEKEIQIRAEGGPKHWSGLGKRDRELAVKEGRHERTVIVAGINLIRDLRDEMFVLSGQDLAHEKLPYRAKVKGLVRERLESSEDPHAPGVVVEMLKEMGARPEAPRALQWAMDQLVTDVRYDMGLLPV